MIENGLYGQETEVVPYTPPKAMPEPESKPLKTTFTVFIDCPRCETKRPLLSGRCGVCVKEDVLLCGNCSHSKAEHHIFIGTRSKKRITQCLKCLKETSLTLPDIAIVSVDKKKGTEHILKHLGKVNFMCEEFRKI